MIRFTVPGPPIGKQRPRVVNGRAYTPKRTREYEERVRMCALGVTNLSIGDPRWVPYEGAVYLDLRIYHADRRRRDADNVVKAIMDGLTGVLWEDDADVWPRVQYVERGSDNPRVEVVVREA